MRKRLKKDNIQSFVSATAVQREQRCILFLEDPFEIALFGLILNRISEGP
jgi:hypothetical protein